MMIEQGKLCTNHGHYGGYSNGTRFYIGSRSINILLQGDTGRGMAEAVVSDDGKLTEINILHGGESYGSTPKVLINNKETDFLDATLSR